LDPHQAPIGVTTRLFQFCMSTLMPNNPPPFFRVFPFYWKFGGVFALCPPPTFGYTVLLWDTLAEHPFTLVLVCLFLPNLAQYILRGAPFLFFLWGGCLFFVCEDFLCFGGTPASQPVSLTNKLPGAFFSQHLEYPRGLDHLLLECALDG